MLGAALDWPLSSSRDNLCTLEPYEIERWREQSASSIYTMLLVLSQVAVDIDREMAGSICLMSRISYEAVCKLGILDPPKSLPSTLSLLLAEEKNLHLFSGVHGETECTVYCQWRLAIGHHTQFEIYQT